jgi:hypothetical protein
MLPRPVARLQIAGRLASIQQALIAEYRAANHSQGIRRATCPQAKESDMNESRSHAHQLCFRSLFNSGRGFAFPCDPTGHVDLDSMSERARNNYFFARAMVGRELAVPAVETTLH